MHFNAVNFAIYVSFHRGSERKKNTQNTERHFERSSCFGPFPAIQIASILCYSLYLSKSFLTPDTEGSCDRHRVIARSRCFSLWRLVRSPSGRWSLKVLRFFDFETFDFRKTKKDIWRIRWHAPAVILQSNFSLLPLWCCDNSIIEVGLCLFRWFRRIFENCSYTHWAMTDLDRRIFESGHIPTEL